MTLRTTLAGMQEDCYPLTTCVETPPPTLPPPTHPPTGADIGMLLVIVLIATLVAVSLFVASRLDEEEKS